MNETKTSHPPVMKTCLFEKVKEQRKARGQIHRADDSEGTSSVTGGSGLLLVGNRVLPSKCCLVLSGLWLAGRNVWKGSVAG